MLKTIRETMKNHKLKDDVIIKDLANVDTFYKNIKRDQS